MGENFSGKEPRIESILDGGGRTSPSSYGKGVRRDFFWTWLASVALFFVFGCISLWKALGGEATCGCFGRLDVNPWNTAALDWGLVAALMTFHPRGPFTNTLIGPVGSLRVAAVLAVWIALGGAVALAMASYRPAVLSDAGEVLADGTVVLEPGNWVGKRFPLLNFIDIADRLKRGEWTIVLYRHGCVRCSRVIAKILSDGDKHSGGPIALVQLSSDAPRPNDHGRAAQRTVVHARLTGARQWFVQAPVVLCLRDAAVVTVDQPRVDEFRAEGRNAL